MVNKRFTKGDIVRLTKILSISFIIFARWQHVSRSWSWGYIWDPYFGRRGGRSRVGGHLCIVTTALSPTMCRRMFPTIKSTELGHFGAKFREAGHNNMISSAYRTYFCIPDSKSSKTVHTIAAIKMTSSHFHQSQLRSRFATSFNSLNWA